MSGQVLPFVRPVDAAKTKPPARQTTTAAQVYQRAIREWRPHLDTYEFSVLLEIIDRTAGWNKAEVNVSTARLLDGDKMYAGLGSQMHRSKMFKALAGLEAKGFVTRSRDRKGHLVIQFNKKWSPDMLNLPKRLQGRSPTETLPVSNGDFPVSNGDPVYSIPEMVSGDSNPLGSAEPRPVPNPMANVRAALETAVSAHRAAATTRAAKTAKVETSVGIEAAWKAAMLEAFPGSMHVPFSIREKAQIKAKVKAWLHAGEIGFPEFVDWAVRNWSAVLAKQFSWMTRSEPPKTPSLPFLLHFIGQFAECWSEGKLDEWLAAPERTEMEKLLASGLSHEEAAAEIGKRRATEGMREENQKAIAEARSIRRQAKIVEQRTRNVEVAPVHPRSRAAEEQRAAINPPPRRRALSDEELKAHDFTAAPTLDPNWEPPLD